MKMTPQQKRGEMRSYMNMLVARFDKDQLENRWKAIRLVRRDRRRG